MDDYVSNIDDSDLEDQRRFKDRNCKYRNGSQISPDSTMTLLLNQIIDLQREHGRDLKNLSEKVVGWDNFKRFREELIGRQEGLEERQKNLEGKVDDLNEICVQFETLKPSLTTESLLKDAKAEVVQEAEIKDGKILEKLEKIDERTKKIESWTQILSFTAPALMKNKTVLIGLFLAALSLATTVAYTATGRVYDYGLKETLLIAFATFCILVVLCLLIIVIRAKGDPKKMKMVFLTRILIIFFILIIPCFSQDDIIPDNTDISFDDSSLDPTLDDFEVFTPTDDHPIILPSDKIGEVSDIMNNAINKIIGNPLAEQNQIDLKNKMFLGNDSVNITYLNNSTSLFYA